MVYQKITGAWVDGMAAPLDQTGRSLRGLLRQADMVTLVISDGITGLHSVTVCGHAARRLADLVTASDDASEEVTSATGPGDVSSLMGPGPGQA